MPVFDIDAFADPQIDVVARLLYESLRARYGDAILAEVTTRPITTFADLGNHEFPLLVVARMNDRTDADDDVSDNEVCTLSVEYYAELTPLDTVTTRWPRLRVVWEHCLSRLHAGFDPLVVDHHVNVAATDEPERWIPMMAAHGWTVPSRPVTNVKYVLAQTGSEGGDPQPCFQATVTMRTNESYDWTFADTYEHPALEGVDAVVVASAPTEADPDATQPAFSSSITFD